MPMLVEIWSDIMCPFCYLGKRRFESALAQFDGRDSVEVVWRSFQLDPSLRPGDTMSTTQYLSSRKRIDAAVARAMNARVAQAGRLEGIEYDFDAVQVTNTFDAHRFAHFAKEHGAQDAAEERLFRAHFSEGRNVGEHHTLLALGRDIGLDGDAVARALATDAYADAVRADIREARELGINGVPFFVFDRKIAVSGAQDTATFLDALTEGVTT